MARFTVKSIDLRYGGTKMILMNEEDASKLDIYPYDRIMLTYGNKSLTVAVALTKSLVPVGSIGLPKETVETLGVSEGDVVGIYPVSPPSSVSFIRKKISGGRLTKEEVLSIIRDVVNGSLSEIEITAFLLAQELVGLDSEEIAYLTEAMVETGNRIIFEDTVYDIHSIGGVPGNSKVALLEVPIVASVGLLIPKTSSRAITSPAGTADTMEVLARVDLELDEIREVATKTRGVIVWGGKLNIAPADDIFIKVERNLSLDPLSQTIASILSKKLAMGVSRLVVDLPVGRGAKVSNMDIASKMARLFIEVSERLGLRTKCAITYGGQPIGYYIGPALEAKEALIALREGRGAMSLIEKATSLAGLIFEIAGLVSRGSGQDLAKEVLFTGKAWKKMKEIIEAQGGDPKIRPDDIPIGDKKVEVVAPVDGYVTNVDNIAIATIAKAAGAPKDKGAGVVVHVKAGAKVRRGEVLIEIYSESESKLTTAYNMAIRLRPIRLEGMLLKEYPE
ncbi:MAG: AMP phosphorylase [Thermoprotei archaeon]|nr:MAG: AMP phosphorylase [Thermoprotei archaeon]